MAYFQIDGYNSYSGCDITVTAALPMINGKQLSKFYTLGSLQTLSISTHQDKRPVRSLGIINAKDYVMGPRTIAGSMVFAVFNRHFATEIMADLGASGSDVVLPDEIPALNITVNFANEYGRMSRMAIYGVQIINEGQVMSINDLYTENTYQFVALGLEPLNSDVSSSEGSKSGSTKKDTKPREVKFNDTTITIDPTIREINSKEKGPFPQYTDDLPPIIGDWSPGKDIVDEINNTRPLLPNEMNTKNQFYLTDQIQLSAKTQRPLTKNDSALVTFKLDPDQKNGTIYVSRILDNIDNGNDPDNGNGSDSGSGGSGGGSGSEGNTGGSGNNTSSGPNNRKHLYSIDVANKSNYILALPAGHYTAQYVSPSDELSNIVNFEMEKFNEHDTVKIKKAYPFIDKVDTNYMVVSSGDYGHSLLEYGSSTTDIKETPIGKKPITINNLNVNKQYKVNTIQILAQDAATYRMRNLLKFYSEDLYVKTHENNQGPLALLKDFVVLNKNLLYSTTNDILKLLDDKSFDDHASLIDLVLSLPNSVEKQELLIFANILTRQLITSYNISNTNHIINFYNKNPFDTSIYIDGFNKANFYVYQNNKVSLDKSINPAVEDFYALPNKHYCVHGVDDGIKTVKVDFAVCSNIAYEELSRYREVDKYKDLNLDAYLTEYKNFDNKAIEAFAIQDHCYTDINILPPPYVYYSDIDHKIHADVKYLNLKQNETYYLVFSEIHDALDYMPHRKIPFTMKTNEIILDNHYLGILKDNIYALWIENKELMKISRAYLYTHVENNIHSQFVEIEKRNIRNTMIGIKKDLIWTCGNKTLITDYISETLIQVSSLKDLVSLTNINLINSMSNSLYIDDVLTPLFELNKITHKQDNITIDLELELDFKDRRVTMKTDQDLYMCAIYYDNEKAIRLSDETGTIYLDSDGYTMIYFVSTHMFYKTGFILIDNRRNNYLATNDVLKCIKRMG